MKFIGKLAALAIAAFAVISLESCNKELEPMQMGGVWKKSSEYQPTLGYAKVSGVSSDAYENALSKFKAKESLVDNIKKGMDIITNVEISTDLNRCTVFAKDGGTYMGTVEITYDTENYKAFIIRVPEFGDFDGDANNDMLEIFFGKDYIYENLVQPVVTADEYNLFKSNIDISGILVFSK